MGHPSVRFRGCKVREAVALTPKLKCAQNPLGVLKTVLSCSPRGFDSTGLSEPVNLLAYLRVFQNMLRLLCQGCAFRIIGLQC